MCLTWRLVTKVKHTFFYIHTLSLFHTFESFSTVRKLVNALIAFSFEDKGQKRAHFFVQVMHA